MKTQTSEGTPLIRQTLSRLALWVFLMGPLASSGLSQEAKSLSAPPTAPVASTATNDPKGDKIDKKDAKEVAAKWIADNGMIAPKIHPQDNRHGSSDAARNKK